jgi:hypothetical protein
MNKKIIGLCIMTLLICPAVISVSACTGFTASDGEDVLVGCNFDWSRDFNVFINFLPAKEGKYGRVVFDIWWPWFGDPDVMLPIQGMNDQGLFYDTYYTPYHESIKSKDKPIFSSNDPDYIKYGWMGILPYCLAECATISEILEVFDQYNHELMTEGQCFFVDRNGDSVIIEGDDIIYREGNFQVVTNFLQSNPNLGELMGAFERYYTAVSMLENMTDLNVDYFKSICNATHLSTSVFSNIYDLKREKIYVHYFYDYDDTVILDLNEELNKGENSIYLGSLFNPEGNQGPSKPETPAGNVSGSPGEIYSYTVRKVKDPDGDLLSYKWDWGDGNYSYWNPAPTMGTYMSSEYNWSKEGTYEIRVKAMDMYGNEGEWSDPLVVSMPKEKSNLEFNTWLFRLIKRFPILKLVIS